MAIRSPNRQGQRRAQIRNHPGLTNYPGAYSSQEKPKLQKFKGLYLSKTQITDAGLKEVAKFQKLTRLTLSGKSVTYEGLNRTHRITIKDNSEI